MAAGESLSQIIGRVTGTSTQRGVMDISRAQARTLVERLRQRGVPVELIEFPGEGHGFRNGAVQRQVLQATEAFFRRHFQL